MIQIKLPEKHIYHNFEYWDDQANGIVSSASLSCNFDDADLVDRAGKFASNLDMYPWVSHLDSCRGLNHLFSQLSQKAACLNPWWFDLLNKLCANWESSHQGLKYIDRLLILLSNSMKILDSLENFQLLKPCCFSRSYFLWLNCQRILNLGSLDHQTGWKLKRTVYACWKSMLQWSPWALTEVEV